MLEKEEAMIRNLRDAGCQEATIQQFLHCLKNGDIKTGEKILSEHRKELLGAVHNGEKQIDYLDYFMYQLNKER